MRRVIVLMMVLAMLAAGSAAKPAPKVQDHKVDVCHHTGSEKNPVVVINVANRGWANGHDKASHHDDSDLLAEEGTPRGPTFKSGVDPSCVGEQPPEEESPPAE